MSKSVTISAEPEFKFDKKEDKIVAEILEHIEGTYNQHYCGPDKSVQVIDLLLSIGTAREYFRGNIIKYASRYGHKDGYNKQDLLKAAHFLLLLIYCDFYEDKPNAG